MKKYALVFVFVLVATFGLMTAKFAPFSEPPQVGYLDQQGNFIPLAVGEQPQSNFQTAVEAGRETVSESLVTLRCAMLGAVPLLLVLILARFGFAFGTSRTMNPSGVQNNVGLAIGKNARVHHKHGALTGQQPQHEALPSPQQTVIIEHKRSLIDVLFGRNKLPPPR